MSTVACLRFCRTNRRKFLLGILATLMLLSGCAKPPVYIAYPPAPQPPRLQFLTALNNEYDLTQNHFVKTLTGDVVGMQLTRATDVTHFGDKILVAHPAKTNPGYMIFDLGKKAMDIVTEPLQSPVAISVDASGNRYVADTKLNAVLVFNPDNVVIGKFTSSAADFRPTSSVPLDGKLYVCDRQHSVVRVFDLASKQELFAFGDGQLGWPNDIKISPFDGNLVVTETGQDRVSIFTPEGASVFSFGKPGKSPGFFSRPKGTAVDRHGNYYVTDAAFQNVQIMNKEGAYRMDFGSSQRVVDQMILPSGIHIDYDNVAFFKKFAAPDFEIEYLLYVAAQGALDWGGSRILVYGFGRKAGADYSAYED